MTRAVLSLGANLGDRAGTLRAALTALKDDGLVARSVLYETPPWGPVEQPPYLNAIAVVRAPRDAATLATTVLAAQAGVWGVRVHDAGASVDAVRTVQAVRDARRSRG